MYDDGVQTDEYDIKPQINQFKSHGHGHNTHHPNVYNPDLYQTRQQPLPPPPVPISVQNNVNVVHGINNRYNNECNQCLKYMEALTKNTELLRENQRLLNENIELKTINHRNQSDKVYWKQQYEQLLSNFNELKNQQQCTNNNQFGEHQQVQQVAVVNDHDEEEYTPIRCNKNTPSYSKMSVSRMGGGNDGFHEIINPVTPRDDNILFDHDHAVT
eukprot:553722_1